MNKNGMSDRHGERGGARAKLIVFLAIFGIVLYVGYLYVPVAYDAYYFKDVMQNKVDIASTQGYETVRVRDHLVKSGPEYPVPPEAIIPPAQKDTRIEVRVQFTRPIQFPGYTYN